MSVRLFDGSRVTGVVLIDSGLFGILCHRLGIGAMLRLSDGC
jgi:hypothetical protein